MDQGVLQRRHLAAGDLLCHLPGSRLAASHSEKLSAPRPSSTSCWTSQEAGATFEYQRHFVRLLWQS